MPLFKELIAKRLPITVTHPDMKRYFMTTEEAVSLVLQAASRDERAIYTLDMGEPVKILDLAEGMIEQAGYRPYVAPHVVSTVFNSESGRKGIALFITNVIGVDVFPLHVHVTSSFSPFL